MYRLAFCGSRHFVSLLSLSLVDIVARRFGMSWKQNTKPNGIFVNPIWEATGILMIPIMKLNDNYLCELRYEATGIFVSPILKWAGICVCPILKSAVICVSPTKKKKEENERVSVWARL